MAHEPTWSPLALEEVARRLAEPELAGRGARGTFALLALGFGLAGAAVGGGSEERRTWSAGRADELAALRARALELLDGVDEGLERLERARALPETDATRTGAVEKAALRRVELPLEAMELAVAGLRILAVDAPGIDAALTRIGAAAAVLFAAASAIAAPEARSALATLADVEGAMRYRMAADALGAEATALADEVRRETEHRAA